MFQNISVKKKKLFFLIKLISYSSKNPEKSHGFHKNIK